MGWGLLSLGYCGIWIYGDFIFFNLLAHTDKGQQMTDELEAYEQKSRPRLRSLISRGSKVVRDRKWDAATGEWREIIRMSRVLFDDKAKEVFLREYAEWGRMGEAAAAAGVTANTVRGHIAEDEEFAKALMEVEQDYTDKLIAHHQNLLFNGTEKNSYDRMGNLVSTETIYPIRLIELELKKHDKGYRDKQEVAINHTGGVLVAPAEMVSIDDWEKKFKKDNNDDIDEAEVVAPLGLPVGRQDPSDED